MDLLYNKHMLKLDSWIRSGLRFIRPNCYYSYFYLRKKIQLFSKDSSKVACYNMKNIAIDKAGGRYLFHIVYDFLQQGYQPVYLNSFRALANMQQKTYKKKLFHLPFSIVWGTDLLKRKDLLITDNKKEQVKKHR